MDTIGDTVTAILTTMTGIGWALYFAAGAVVVGVTLAIENKRTKGQNRG